MPVWKAMLSSRSSGGGRHGGTSAWRVDVRQRNEGGSTGSLVAPGDRQINRDQAAKHAGQLSEFELSVLREWLAAGAPESNNGLLQSLMGLLFFSSDEQGTFH